MPTWSKLAEEDVWGGGRGRRLMKNVGAFIKVTSGTV